MGKRFINNVYEGKNAGWHYLLVLGGVVIYWLFFAYLTEVVAQSMLLKLAFPKLAAQLISGALPFAVVIGWLAIALDKLHNRPLRSLINAEPTLNYKRIAQGFWVWATLAAIWTGLDLWTHPDDYAWTFEPQRWILLFLLSVFLVPVQTSAEELLYRGYMMQGLRLITKNSLVLTGVTGLAFAIPHFGNPEMMRTAFIWGALDYFAWGVIFAAITLKDNGLELSLGVHAANNLFCYLIVGSHDSVVTAPALWVYQVPMLGAHASWLYLLMDGAIFYAIFFGGISRPHASDDTLLDA